MTFLDRLFTGTHLSWGPAAARPVTTAVPSRIPRRATAATSLSRVATGRAAGAPTVIRGEGPRALHP